MMIWLEIGEVASHKQERDAWEMESTNVFLTGE